MKHIYILSLAVLLACSCKRTDNFYSELDDTPQIATSARYAYRSAYAIGDTMILAGRLAPLGFEQLQVRVGDASAVLTDMRRVKLSRLGGIVVNETISFKDSIDIVKFVITEAMGIGDDRPVIVQAGNKSVQGRAITITEFGKNQAFTDTLSLALYYDGLDAADFIFNSVNGKGVIYLGGRGGLKVLGDGEMTTLLTSYADAHGHFTIRQMQGGSVDPQGRFLYFSALCEEAGTDPVAVTIFRLCKFDLEARQLITLNRTVFRLNAFRDFPDSEEAYIPVEGDITQAKLFGATALSVDGRGNIYFLRGNKGNPGGGSVLACIDNGGKVRNVFRNSNANTELQYVRNNITSYVNNPGLLFNSLNQTNFIGADPEGLLYLNYNDGLISGQSKIKVYDPATQTSVYDYYPGKPRTYNEQLTGRFADLSFFLYAPGVGENPYVSLLPVAGNRLLFLYTDQNRGAPAADCGITVLDFQSSTAYYYAPPPLRHDKSKFLIEGADRSTARLLNYDAEGHVYIAASTRWGGRPLILKTTIQ